MFIILLEFCLRLADLSGIRVQMTCVENSQANLPADMRNMTFQVGVGRCSDALQHTHTCPVELSTALDQITVIQCAARLALIFWWPRLNEFTSTIPQRSCRTVDPRRPLLATVVSKSSSMVSLCNTKLIWGTWKASWAKMGVWKMIHASEYCRYNSVKASIPESGRRTRSFGRKFVSGKLLYYLLWCTCGVW